MVRPYPRFEGLEHLIRAMATSLFVEGKNLEFARRGRPGPRSMWRGSRRERQRRYGGMRMRSTRSQPAASRTSSELEKRLAERAKVEHSPKPLAFAIRPRLRECGPSTWPLRLRPATMHMKISFPSQNCSQLSNLHPIFYLWRSHKVYMWYWHSRRDGGSMVVTETWENFVNLGTFCKV